MNKFKETYNRQLKAYKSVDNFDQFQRIQQAITQNPPITQFKKFKLRVGFLLQQLGLWKVVNIEKYFTELEFTYNKLETEESKELFVKLLLFRKLGYAKVKLPLCNDEFIKGIEQMRQLADNSQTFDPNFLTWKLHKFNLKPIGYDIELFFEATSVYIEFVLNPYEYNKNGIAIRAEENDTVIDAGGCWGDTALNFASRVGDNGKVYSFEFIPGNVDIMKRNFSLNKPLEKRIEIVEHPVWNESDVKMYCNDFGPASTIQSTYSAEHNIEVSAITIDDFVLRKNVQRIDFIKMDIEGAETFALKGAIETIKKFKPKLAISVYHSLTDFFEIPKLIDELDLGYKFYMDHFTHMSGETVLYAKAD